MKTLQEINAEMDQYLIAGEIPNPRYLEIKERLSRSVYKYRDDFRRYEYVSKLDLPMYISAVKSFKKKLEKFKGDKATPQYQSLVAMVETYLPLAEKLEQLKKMIVKGKKSDTPVVPSSVLSERKQILAVLIKESEAFKADYLAGVRENAISFYTFHFTRLKEWGIDKIKKELPDMKIFYYGLEKSTIEKEVEKEVKGSELEFIAFLHKMVEKIGKPISTASITYTRYEAGLDINCVDGEKQVWHMNIIANRSKYNKFFWQFPVRKVN